MIWTHNYSSSGNQKSSPKVAGMSKRSQTAHGEEHEHHWEEHESGEMAWSPCLALNAGEWYLHGSGNSWSVGEAIPENADLYTRNAQQSRRTQVWIPGSKLSN